jgi:orotate phosphoribosyltransferase
MATMRPRQGHFEFESGLHGTLLLDVDALISHPKAISYALNQLARDTRSSDAQVVCGPMNGGAIIGFALAERVGIDFVASQRAETAETSGLFRYQYLLRAEPGWLRNRRVFVVDDVINAGSAVRATLEALDLIGARPVGLGAVVTLGDAAKQLAQARELPLFRVATAPTTLWRPDECPMCATGQPFERRVD